MAADSAVMVIDGAKGVEPQTQKLFPRLRPAPHPHLHLHQQDGPGRATRSSCARRSSSELGIDTYAVNWPIGCGKEFQGVYDREKQCIIHFTDAGHARRPA